MAGIEIVTIDLDTLDLNEETKALLLACIPDKPIAEAMVVAGLVPLH